MIIKIEFEPEKELLKSKVDENESIYLELSRGPTPLGLLLISLGACAAITLYKSLLVRGGKVKRIEVTLMKSDDINRAEDFKDVMIEFLVEASNVTAKEVEEVAKSSLRGECIVARILMQGIKCHPIVKLKKLKEDQKANNRIEEF